MQLLPVVLTRAGLTVEIAEGRRAGESAAAEAADGPPII
jgi:hypothetical protein